MKINSNLGSMAKTQAAQAQGAEGFSSADRASIRKSAEEFEAIFIEIMLKSMRSTIQKADLVDGGNGEEVFRSMLDTEYAKSMASSGGPGIADDIERQLLQLGGHTQKDMQLLQGLKAYDRSGGQLMANPPLGGEF